MTERSHGPGAGVGLQVDVGSFTSQGKRPRNEDYAACYLGAPPERLENPVIAALSDGMGGAKGGRVAAEIAVHGFIEACVGQVATVGIARISARAMDSVNRWIHAIGRTDPALAGMACTLTALILCGRRVHVVHIGDSRLYRLRDQDLALLTTDHTLGKPGTTHALTRAVGAQDAVRADHAVEAARAFDRYLLCSDGVHGVLSRKQIFSILAQRSAPAEAARRLVEAAEAERGEDNSTAMVVDVLALPVTQLVDLAVSLAEQPLHAAPRTGAVVDGYKLVAMLADGRYSRVFRAMDQIEQRAVILKFPKPQAGLEALLRTAMLREMWIVTRVRSPFVTEVLEPAPERRSCLYCVMPCYDGETLEQRLRRTPPVSSIAGLDISIKLAKAVAALHRAGVIHRDIKPENIILESNGGLKLIDLGVARLPNLEELPSVEIPGTPSYMAPELLKGSVGDEGSDIFALGVTLYRMFSGGAYPYGEIEAFSHPHFGKPAPLSKHRPDLPAWLDHVLARAIAIDRNDRFADVIELAFELEHGSLRAVPQTVQRVALYDRNPTGFWQIISILLLVALLIALGTR